MPLTEHKITLNNKSARFYNFAPTPHPANTTRPLAHFYGGNGFPVGVYTPLLNILSHQFDISSLAMQGYWYDQPKTKVLTREQDADNLITFLEQTQPRDEQGKIKPVIGIAHSQGATATAIACAKRPDLFKTLILLEPVSFTRKQAKLYQLIPNFLKMRYEPFASTVKKQMVWHSVMDYYQYLRNNSAFKRISDENLQTFATQSLEKTGNELSLIFSPKQELASYFGIPFIDDALQQINQKNIPYTIFMGKPSLFISNEVRAVWRQFVPESNLLTFTDYGHLLPLEAPELCAKNILKIYNKT